MAGKQISFVRRPFLRFSLFHLLIAAACLHVLTTLTIYTAARLSILPHPFVVDGLGQFTFDSSRYQQEAETLVGVLNNDGVAAWLHFPFQSHVHLYSLCFAIFSPVVGYSVLAVEPLNLFYYLASLILIYQIGKEAFGQMTGLAAAIVIALWPSFLLHTTQFLKDPLFIVCMLSLVFVCILWLTRICSWKNALLTAALGAASVAVVGQIKANMWESIVVIIVICLILLLLRQARAGRIYPQNMLSVALIVIFALVIPVRTTDVHERDQKAIQESQQLGQTSFAWTALGARVAERRRVFNVFGGSRESTIDGALVFNNTGDIVRYLPRATLIGLFAPFPPMWLAPAPIAGRAARFVTGAETFLFYLLALAAVICAYVERRNFSTWFLLLVALVNIVALGLIVTNIGSLFRLRYVFWMLIIIMGARGAIILLHSKEKGDGRSAA